jgi:hypothetical protein
MSAPSAELLVIVAVLVLLAVAAGTICARLFMAASRDYPSRRAPDKPSPDPAESHNGQG